MGLNFFAVDIATILHVDHVVPNFINQDHFIYISFNTHPTSLEETTTPTFAFPPQRGLAHHVVFVILVGYLPTL